MLRNLTIATVCVSAMSLAGVAEAGFSSFVIRNGAGGSPDILPNNVYVPGATEFVISEGGMKAGLGSNDVNGATIGDLTQMTIVRYDDTTRFSAGSGPAVGPYINIWVTDGLGNYAVIANEPSNPAFQPLFTDTVGGYKTYDLDFADISGKVAKVYETPGWNTNSSWVHTMFGSDPLTFGDLASLTIAPPPASYITTPANGVGSGAPDELGTNVAYGFNWVFGDTLSNYVSGAEGYVVGDAAVAPEPASLALLGLGGLALIKRKRA
ncbi:MAG: PEP-CTERM sorting domain-containing protein [Phycisphaerales bacterium]